MYNFDELEDSLDKMADVLVRYLEELQSNTLSEYSVAEAFYGCAKGGLYGMNDIYFSDSIDITDLI